jgi:hypothetical protein
MAVSTQVTYSGYFHRDEPEPELELARVGPGTPCGEYLRRFWHPVAHIEDLKDVPHPLRILGEDLVLFRDGRGEIGLLRPPGHLAGVRHGGAARPALLLSRLALRRRRSRAGDAGRA